MPRTSRASTPCACVGSRLCSRGTARWSASTTTMTTASPCTASSGTRAVSTRSRASSRVRRRTRRWRC
eukprot:1892614-Rhodomonas_salina.1